MISNKRSVSRVVSEVVGSSKMMIRASAPSALAISTNWRSPCESRLTGVAGGTSRSTARSSSSARAPDRTAVDQRQRAQPAAGTRR